MTTSDTMPTAFKRLVHDLTSTDIVYHTVIPQLHLLTAFHHAVAAHESEDTPWVWREPLVAQSLIAHLNHPMYSAHARNLATQLQQ